MFSKAFSEEVERIVRTDRVGYVDAIIHCCDKQGIEIESAVRMLNKQIKQSLEMEADALRLLR